MNPKSFQSYMEGVSAKPWIYLMALQPVQDKHDEIYRQSTVLL